ncbi:MAG: alpha/beta fold hydrolase, partial [Bacteroidales bacterium]|nr:alpha/beta fold hydrolase [Bacteroidales bacterium]
MKLFFRKYGSGLPLIILHGLYGSSDNWVSLAKSISDRFTVYLPDQRNHGQSPHSEVHDYKSMKEDLYELTVDLGLDRFFLAGHSMGGKTAMAFAMSWPEKLYGLLIGDISPVSSEVKDSAAYSVHSEILDSILSVDLEGKKSRDEIEAILSQKISSPVIRGFIMKNLRRLPGDSFAWKLNAPLLKRNLREIIGGIKPGKSDYGEVSGFPVLFLKGENSDYISESDYAEIRTLFPGAEFVTIPGAGHWIHSDNPGAVRKS